MRKTSATMCLVVVVMVGTTLVQAKLIGLGDFSGNEKVLTFNNSVGGCYLIENTGYGFEYTSNRTDLFDNIPGASLGTCIFDATPSPTGHLADITINFTVQVNRMGLLLAHNNSMTKEWMLMIYGDSQILGQFFTSAPPDNAIFFGVEYADNIKSVNIKETGVGDWGQTFIDDVRFEVPEPATLLLLGLGAVTLRKRRVYEIS